MNSVFKGIIISFIRHALTAGGTYLVTKGITDAATADTIVGGVMAAFAVGWSMLAKSDTNNLK